MDKKIGGIAVVTAVMFGGLTAAAIFQLLKPSLEVDISTGAPLRFDKKPLTAGQANRAAQLPVESSAVVAPDSPNSSESQGGSLGFIKKDDAYRGSESSRSTELDAAARRGDAKGVVDELRQGDKKDAKTRAVMQKLVDAVKAAKPSWYKQFLADEDLKAIADRYNSDQDFGAFVRLLSKSHSFSSLLKQKSRGGQLRGLLLDLLAEDALAAQLRGLLLERKDDPHLLSLLRRHGAEAGVPGEILEAAGVSSVKEAPRKATPKAQPQSKPKLQLNKSGAFGSFADRPAKAGDGEDEIDPAMAEQYRKYMGK